MWKAPNRPSKEITSTFESGIVQICDVRDCAEPGRKPIEKLVPKARLRFEERQVGVTRYYNARQNQVQIEHLIRVPRHDCVSTQDVAIISGKQYRIDSIQTMADTYPPSMDLTLVKIEQDYEVLDGTV
jgi:SPP1 family predicted phage head-tail adaptor